MKLIVVGIDPGLFGAVAALDEDGRLIFAQDTPIIALTMLKQAQAFIEAEAAKAERQKIVAVPAAVLERLNGQAN